MRLLTLRPEKDDSRDRDLASIEAIVFEFLKTTPCGSLKYSASLDLWNLDLWTKPDLWTVFQGTKNPQIGYEEDFRK